MRHSPLDPRELAAVSAPLAEARPFPGRAFVDDAVFAFERDELFGRAWSPVARSDEAELPGQWVREDVAGEAILAVRGPDLRLRAFHDVCTHRGASLSGGAPCGRAARLACPYHGWTYELDGRLALAPFAPASLDRAKHGLREVRIEEWRGFVFVNLDPAAPALAELLAETPPWLDEATLRILRRGRRASWVTKANWKLCVENFQESHHFGLVHRALETLTPSRSARTWAPSDPRSPWLGGTMEIEGGETVSRDGARHDRPRLRADEGSPARVYDAMLFPAFLTSLQPDYFLTYRLVPLGAAETRVVFDVFFHPAAFVPDFDPQDVYAFWDRVNAEDRAICEDQQANAASRAFAPSCYATVEEGVHAFDRKVAAAHLDARDGAEGKNRKR